MKNSFNNRTTRRLPTIVTNINGLLCSLSVKPYFTHHKFYPRFPSTVVAVTISMAQYVLSPHLSFPHQLRFFLSLLKPVYCGLVLCQESYSNFLLLRLLFWYDGPWTNFLLVTVKWETRGPATEPNKDSCYSAQHTSAHLTSFISTSQLKNNRFTSNLKSTNVLPQRHLSDKGSSHGILPLPSYKPGICLAYVCRWVYFIYII